MRLREFGQCDWALTDCITPCYAPQPRDQGSWGIYGARLGPTGHRWAPCWPHERCYRGMSSQLGDTASIIKKKYMFYVLGEAKDDNESMISEALAPSTTTLQCGVSNLKWPWQNLFYWNAKHPSHDKRVVWYKNAMVVHDTRLWASATSNTASWMKMLNQIIFLLTQEPNHLDRVLKSAIGLFSLKPRCAIGKRYVIDIKYIPA